MKNTWPTYQECLSAFKARGVPITPELEHALNSVLAMHTRDRDTLCLRAQASPGVASDLEVDLQSRISAALPHLQKIKEVTGSANAVLNAANVNGTVFGHVTQAMGKLAEGSPAPSAPSEREEPLRARFTITHGYNDPRDFFVWDIDERGTRFGIATFHGVDAEKNARAFVASQAQSAPASERVARDKALEDAANACDDVYDEFDRKCQDEVAAAKRDDRPWLGNPYLAGATRGALNSARRIRSLKSAPAGGETQKMSETGLHVDRQTSETRTESTAISSSEPSRPRDHGTTYQSRGGEQSSVGADSVSDTTAAPEERGTPFAELIELEKKATPGPWSTCDGMIFTPPGATPLNVVFSTACEIRAQSKSPREPFKAVADRDFLVALRNAWPKLLAALPPVPRARETRSGEWFVLRQDIETVLDWIDEFTEGNSGKEATDFRAAAERVRFRLDAFAPDSPSGAEGRKTK